MSLHLERIAEIKALKQTTISSFTVNNIVVNGNFVPAYIVTAVNNFLQPKFKGILNDLQNQEESLAAPELDQQISDLEALLAAAKKDRAKLP